MGESDFLTARRGIMEKFSRLRGIEVFSVLRTLSFGPLIMREGPWVTVT